MHHRAACLLEPIAVVVGLRRTRAAVLNDVRVFLGQFGAPFLGGAQLISIRGDLSFQETLRAIHLSPAAAGHLFGENRQERLNDVLR